MLEQEFAKAWQEFIDFMRDGFSVSGTLAAIATTIAGFCLYCGLWLVF